MVLNDVVPEAECDPQGLLHEVLSSHSLMQSLHCFAFIALQASDLHRPYMRTRIFY